MDLNSDLGEAYGAWTMGDDEAVLDVVTSANIACGFHAGDPVTMHRTARSAVSRGIAIGAHIAYPDLRGFGRRHVALAPEELTADVLYQLGALDALATAAGGRVSYVKPHGALYNEMAVDDALARTVLTAITSFSTTLPILTLPGSATERVAAELGTPCFTEGFADRGYTDNGQLVPRTQPGAVLHDPDAIAERVVRMATEGTVVTASGSVIEVDVATVCIHGDTPGAVRIAHAVRDALLAAGVGLAPFVSDVASDTRS
jgi:UPF0271 protein